MANVKKRRWLLAAAMASLALSGAVIRNRQARAEAQFGNSGLGQSNFPVAQGSNRPRISKKQRQAMLRMNFGKMKKQAVALAVLAESLRKDIDRSNANVLSVTIIKKAKKIQKLAKSIQNAARGY